MINMLKSRSAVVFGRCNVIAVTFRLALAECEVICDFIPYGSSADKMLEIFEGETLL